LWGRGAYEKGIIKRGGGEKMEITARWQNVCRRDKNKIRKVD
jgi:hypothetical protein